MALLSHGKTKVNIIKTTTHFSAVQKAVNKEQKVTNLMHGDLRSVEHAWFAHVVPREGVVWARCGIRQKALRPPLADLRIHEV